MNFREPSRPYDPTASSLQNLVIAEKRPLGTNEYYIFVPSHGPYYSDSLKVYSGGKLLEREKDYRTLVHHPRASGVTAKEVSVCVQIINTSLTEVDITYQVVGGGFQCLFEIIKLIKDSYGDKVLRPILWHEIIGKPDSFNPAAHWHVIWDISGWEKIITPIDQIRQAITFKKQQAYRDIYDYYYAKQIAHQNNVDSRIAALRQKAEAVWSKIRPPVGIVTITTKPNLTFPDGDYVEMKNTLLWGVSADGDLGKTWNVSKDLVFPYPDNLLLNEKEYPILQEKDEFIFLDNEHPVSPKVTHTEEYWEEIDELFDALTVKIWKKTTQGGEFRATLTAAPTTINENEVTLFTLNTVGFAQGTQVPYRLTGIGPNNVNVPLDGVVTINSVGVGTLAVKLVAGSPRTDTDTMRCDMLVAGGLNASVKYNLLSNVIQSTDTTLHQYANGPLLTSPIVRGDWYVMKIVHRGMNGKNLKINFGLTVNDRVTINDVLIAGNADYTYAVPATGKYVTLKFCVTSRANIVSNSATLKLTTASGVVESLPYSLDVFEFIALEAYSPATGEVLPSIHYHQSFRLRVKQNSRDNPVVDLRLTGNTTTGVISPSFIPPLYCDRNGIGESGTYSLDEISGTAMTAGKLTFVAVEQQLKKIQITLDLPVII